MSNKPTTKVPPSKPVFLLCLRHIIDPSHHEEWTANADGTVHTVSNRPGNYPSYAEGNLTPFQAMRQYILMTTLEGWFVENYISEWHAYVEALEDGIG